MLNEIVESIFALERVGSGGYSQSTKLDDSRYPYLDIDFNYTPDEIEANRAVLESYFNNTDELGPYEIVILSAIIPPINNTCIAIIGAKGAGKTSTMQYLYKFAIENYKRKERGEEPLVVYCDGHDAYQEILVRDDQNPAAIIRAVFGVMAANIFSTLLNNNWSDVIGVIDDLLFGKPKEQVNQNLFNYRKSLIQSLPNISNVSSVNIDNLTTAFTSLEIQYRLGSSNQFRTVIALIAEIWEGRPSLPFTFICVDNLDPYPEYIQIIIMNSIIAAINEAEIPILLPMRVFTAERANIRAFVHRKIPHSGISPFEEVQYRLRAIIHEYEWVNNDEHYSSASPQTKLALSLRAAEILDILNNEEMRNLFEALSGNSVQRGLSFVRRLFLDDKHIIDTTLMLDTNQFKKIMGIITTLEKQKDFSTDKLEMVLCDQVKELYRNRYGRHPKYYQYLHLLLENATKSVSNFGPIIENIFSDSDMNLHSGIKIHILKLLDRKLKSSTGGAHTTIATIVSACLALGYDATQIYLSINSLLDADRRLMWCVDKYNFRDYSDLTEASSNILGITKSGLMYLEHLIYNVDYSAFMLSSDAIDKRHIRSNALTARITHTIRIHYNALDSEIDFYNQAITPGLQETLKKGNFILAETISHSIKEALDILVGHGRNILDSKFDEHKSDYGKYVERVGLCFGYHNDRLARYGQSRIPIRENVKILDESYARLKRIIDDMNTQLAN